MFGFCLHQLLCWTLVPTLSPMHTHSLWFICWDVLFEDHVGGTECCCSCLPWQTRLMSLFSSQIPLVSFRDIPPAQPTVRWTPDTLRQIHPPPRVSVSTLHTLKTTLKRDSPPPPPDYLDPLFWPIVFIRILVSQGWPIVFMTVTLFWKRKRPYNKKRHEVKCYCVSDRFSKVTLTKNLYDIRKSGHFTYS